jgi:hypothetical protein
VRRRVDIESPKRGLKRGVFRSVADLQAAINRFLEEHNQHSQPFTWTADPIGRTTSFAYANGTGTKC